MQWTLLRSTANQITVQQPFRGIGFPNLLDLITRNCGSFVVLFTFWQSLCQSLHQNSWSGVHTLLSFEVSSGSRCVRFRRDCRVQTFLMAVLLNCLYRFKTCVNDSHNNPRLPLRCLPTNPALWSWPHPCVFEQLDSNVQYGLFRDMFSVLRTN